jgi:predicted dehydrogenase
MIEACEKNNVKLAVATSNRASLAIAEAAKMVSEGRIGKLLMIRANGKDDRRGGGEDLMVLGYHMLDLMCLGARRVEEERC